MINSGLRRLGLAGSGTAIILLTLAACTGGTEKAVTAGPATKATPVPMHTPGAGSDSPTGPASPGDAMPARPGPVTGDLSGDWAVIAGGLGQVNDGTGNGEYIALTAGKVNFTDSGGAVVETAAKTAACPGLAVKLPAGTVLAKLHKTGEGTFTGKAAMWDVTHTTCSFGFWTPVEMTPGDGGLAFDDGGPSYLMASTVGLPVPIRLVLHRYLGTPPAH